MQVRSILEAKDKLYSDLISIQALLMDERKKHSAETYEQQNALELLKETNEKLSRELQQLEVAKATAEYKYVSIYYFFRELYELLLVDYQCYIPFCL